MLNILQDSKSFENQRPKYSGKQGSLKLRLQAALDRSTVKGGPTKEYREPGFRGFGGRW